MLRCWNKVFGARANASSVNMDCVHCYHCVQYQFNTELANGLWSEVYCIVQSTTVTHELLFAFNFSCLQSPSRVYTYFLEVMTDDVTNFT